MPTSTKITAPKRSVFNEAPALHVAVGIKDLHAIFIPAIEGSSPRELPQDDAGQDQQNRDDRHDTAPSDDYLSSFCADDKAAHLIGAHLVAVPIEGRAVARSRHGVGSMPISMAGGFAERSKKGGPKPSRCSFDELGEYRTRQRR
jgi:hypothetical protein